MTFLVTFPCETGGFSSSSSDFRSCCEGTRLARDGEGFRGEGLRGEAGFLLRDGDLERERERRFRPETNLLLGEAERLRLRKRCGFYKRNKQTPIMNTSGHI